MHLIFFELLQNISMDSLTFFYHNPTSVPRQRYLQFIWIIMTMSEVTDRIFKDKNMS